MIDLANVILKDCYKAKSILQMMSTRTVADVARAIGEAKRFILDEGMSELLGHMSVTPYQKIGGKNPDERRQRQGEVLASMRRSAMLPFDKIFVQYDGRAFRKGLLEAKPENAKDLWGVPLQDSAYDVANPVGWLLERGGEFQKMDVVMATEYTCLEGSAEGLATLPFGWCWSVGDSDLNDLIIISADVHHYVDVPAAQLAHGVSGHYDPSFGVVYLNPRGKAGLKAKDSVDVEMSGERKFRTHQMVVECGGVVRYMLAFLNLLNEVPVTFERARRTEHFLSNGKRRTAVDTELIRLVLPNRTITYKEYARQLTHEIVRRKNHPVRGHWRVYGAHHCGENAEHVWGPTDATGHADCTACNASRTWIAEHRRGDRELGVIERPFLVSGRAGGGA